MPLTVQTDHLSPKPTLAYRDIKICLGVYIYGELGAQLGVHKKKDKLISPYIYMHICTCTHAYIYTHMPARLGWP